MSLPYDKMTNIGMLLPFLHEESKEGYENGKSPMEVMKHFFDSHTDLKTEEERIDLLFRIIQYVERQVVLFDSIEDSAFSTLNANTDPEQFVICTKWHLNRESCILLKKNGTFWC